MQKLAYKLIVPALLSISLIVFTAIISQGADSLTPFGRICFLFHAIPSDIGFLDGAWVSWVYYPLLFVLLTFLFFGIGHFIGGLISKYYKPIK